MPDLLTKPGTNATFTIDDMIREAQRELEWRKKTVWKRSPEDFEVAKRRVALQEAIVDALVRVKIWHWPEDQTS